MLIFAFAICACGLSFCYSDRFNNQSHTMDFLISCEEYEVVAPVEKTNKRYKPSEFEQQQREMQEEKAVVDFAGDFFASFIRGVMGEIPAPHKFKLMQVVSRSSNGKLVKVRFKCDGKVYQDYIARNSVLAEALDPHGKHNLNDPPHKQRADMRKVIKRENVKRDREIEEWNKRNGKKKKGRLDRFSRLHR